MDRGTNRGVVRSVPDLHFEVEGARAVPFAVAPLVELTLRVCNQVPDEVVHSGLLRCQVRLEATRRRYSKNEQERLRDLFGEPERWSQTLRGLLWTFSIVTLPPFTGGTTVALPLPCSFDFNVAATKYFYALEDGEVPLTLLFSGTVFYEAEDGAVQVSQISWEREAKYRLPVQIWRAMMDHYYPGTAWLALGREVFDRLATYKRDQNLPTWEAALDRLLDKGEERNDNRSA